MPLIVAGHGSAAIRSTLSVLPPNFWISGDSVGWIQNAELLHLGCGAKNLVVRGAAAAVLLLIAAINAAAAKIPVP